MKAKIIGLCDRGAAIAFYGIAVSLPFSSAFLEIFGTTAIVLFVAQKILQRDLSFLKIPEAYALEVFLCISLVSIFLNPDLMQKSLLTLIAKWGEGVMLFFAAREFLAVPGRFERAVKIFLGMSVLIAVDALTQRFLGVEFLRGRSLLDVAGVQAATASFHHYNHLGSYLLFPLSWSLAFLILKRPLGRLEILGSLGALLLFLTGLALTFSRGAWIGFWFSCFAVAFLSKKWKIFLGITLVLILLAMSLPVVQLRFQGQGTLGIDSGRFDIWSGALKMLSESPLWGKGLGTFMDRIQHYYFGEQGAVYAHNSYLQMLAEIGLLGFIAFLAFLLTVLRPAIRYCREQPSWLRIGMFGGLSGFLVHAFFDNHFYSLQMSFLFWWVLGMIAGLSLRSSGRQNKESGLAQASES